MVVYYNFSGFGDNEGFIEFIKDLSLLSNGIVGYFLLFMIFLVSLLAMIQRGSNVNSAFNVSSLYVMVAAILFYVVGIVNGSLIIYVPALIFVSTLVIRWINR